MERLNKNLPETETRVRKIIRSLLALLLLCVFGTALAEHPAQEMVVNSTTQMLKILKEDAERLKAEPAYLDEVVEEHIVPHVDIRAMTQLSVGKHWRKASKEQRDELMTQFKKLLLNTYTKALMLYSDQEIEFKPFKPEKREDRAVVRALFKQPAASSVPIRLKLRDRGEQGWKIYDIDVDAVNLVSSYRTSFSTKISQSGIDGLIDEMKKRNNEAQDQAVEG